jgi:integrase
MSILRMANCMFANVPTAITRSASLNPSPASASSGGATRVNTLKEWRLACPKGELGLVFPNTLGKLWDHADIVSRYVWPTMVAAGVVDDKGEAKYTGLHALRHFYASWLINRKADGGLELPLKTVQDRLGHSSVLMTSDAYGHLFPRTDDGREMAEAEKLLLA